MQRDDLFTDTITMFCHSNQQRQSTEGNTEYYNINQSFIAQNV